jgi:glycosyltransferase involved in cell wall biosynthesis
MKISVIIPAFNAEKYIAQCIEGILYQTHRDVEIIVVNDGSTDRTAEIAASYPAVRLISQQNQGQSVARNVGAAAATGEYIHFMDADDLVNLDYYARMAEAAAATDADMVFGGYVNEAFPGETVLFADRLLLSAAEDKFAVTRAADMTYAWRYIARRAFMETNGFAFEPGRLFEDMAFTLAAVHAAARIATAPGATYHYMRRDGSSLNSRGAEHVRKAARDYDHADALRRGFMAAHGLGGVVRTVRTTQYKVLGIPMAKRVALSNGKVKFYLFGLRVLRIKDVRSSHA